MTFQCAVVIEKGKTNYGAYVPDLPGCVAVGETIEEVERLIQEAIEFRLEGLLLDNESVPKPTSLCFVKKALAHQKQAMGNKK